MNLSVTAKYAIRAVSFMAYSGKEKLSAKDLVNELQLPDKYLKRILTILNKQGIICSQQGRYGGFTLKKRPEELYLLEVIEAVDDVEKYFGCVLGFEVCSDEKPCALHKKWVPIREELVRFYSENTIADVVKNQVILQI